MPTAWPSVLLRTVTGVYNECTSCSIFTGHVNVGVCVCAPCGLRGCKNGPALFPGRMSYKATKPGLVYVLYLSML